MLTIAADGCYDAILFWRWGTMRGHVSGNCGYILVAVACLVMVYVAGLGWLNVACYELGGGGATSFKTYGTSSSPTSRCTGTLG